MDEPTQAHEPAPVPERPARPARRVSLIVALVLFLAMLGAAGIGATYYGSCTRPPPATGETVAFVVPNGATGETVAEALASEGLTSCGGFVGNLLLRGTGKASQILAGSHELTVGMSLEELVDVLMTPPKKVPTVELTVPEGLRIRSTYEGERSIASVVADRLGLSGSRLAKLAESGRYTLAPYLPDGTATAEGFLFPKTYELRRRGLDEEAVIERMLEQFRIEAEALDLVGGAERLGLTPYELVIVASMIEKEARVDDDRDLIAGVIYNRLDLGMTLGIDATLLYLDPSPDGQLTTADIETDNPYNTRIRAGLPPTPIASPGAASLRAALRPAATDFLFYVLCGEDGAHRFSKTLDEHVRNVKECLG